MDRNPQLFQHFEDADVRRASRVLEAGWKAYPHPEIADAYLHVRAGDAAGDRLKRAESLLRMRPHADEGRQAVARAAIDARDYRRALDILEKVAQLQPNNSEVSGLQEEAWSMISPQVGALVKLGDHLYLDEQLDAAVATWQAALTLKPDDEAILARIERAKTVLNRLDALRRRQNSPPGED